MFAMCQKRTWPRVSRPCCLRLRSRLDLRFLPCSSISLSDAATNPYAIHDNIAAGCSGCTTPAAATGRTTAARPGATQPALATPRAQTTALASVVSMVIVVLNAAMAIAASKMTALFHSLAKYFYLLENYSAPGAIAPAYVGGAEYRKKGRTLYLRPIRPTNGASVQCRKRTLKRQK